MVNGIRFQPISGGEKEYEFHVRGDITPRKSVEKNDNVFEVPSAGLMAAKGKVFGLDDRYFFNGDITRLKVDPGIRVYINGQPTSLGKRSSTIKIRPRHGGKSTYRFVVRGKNAVVPGGDTEPHDNITDKGDRSVVEGVVYGQPDTYNFDGQVVIHDWPRGSDILINGHKLNNVYHVMEGRKKTRDHYKLWFRGPVAGTPNVEVGYYGDSINTVVKTNAGEWGKVSGFTFGAPDSYITAGRLHSVSSDHSKTVGRPDFNLKRENLSNWVRRKF